MAIKKRSIVLSDTSAHTLGLGATYGRILRCDVTSSADTSVSLAVTDADGVTVITFGSADYTTATRKVVEAENAVTEDGTAATGDAGHPLVAKSPLTVTASGLGSGTFTVDVFVEV